MISVSVVICTIENSGRETRLRRVVEELLLQQGVDLQIILVFQADLDAAAPINDPNVRLLRTQLCSSAESRNRGAALASGDYICFLDDDTFPTSRTFFPEAVARLEEQALDFLVCNIASEGKVQSSSPVTEDVAITPSTVMGNMWEPGLLIRRAAFNRTRFDETLGIGCVHGSSEGMDFGIRLLKGGYKGQRFRDVLIDHPPLDSEPAASIERYFFYSLGNGAVLIQHRYYGTYGRALAKAFGRCLLSVLQGRRTRAATALVRISGLVAGPFLPRRPARILPTAALSKASRRDPAREEAKREMAAAREGRS